jgi:hypothetical protein
VSKLIIFIFVIAIMPSQGYAVMVKFAFSPSKHVYEAKITSTDDANLVSFYDGDKFLGTYENLIVNETSFWSGIVPTVDGGVALVIETNASRSKYNALVPIELHGGKLYVRCIYKEAYDAVEQVKFNGTSCEKQDLKLFDVFSVNDKGLHPFDPRQKSNAERLQKDKK